MANVTTGDIPFTFDFSNACHECCFCCIPGNITIYINKNLEVEPFKKSKSANFEKDYEKTIKRIKEALGNTFDEIQKLSVVDLNNTKKLKLKDIVSINDAIISFQDKLTERHKKEDK